jgi:hypothetical protein
MNKSVDRWEQIIRCQWKLVAQSFVSNDLLQFIKIYGFEKSWEGV